MNLAATITSFDQADALERLLAAASTRHAEFKAQSFISQDVVELMKQAGVFRALVAKRFGGDEMHPSDFLRLIETISQADGSTGWVASFGFSAVYLSSLPLATLEKMYADGPDVVFAGGIFPPQRAIPVTGGLEVSGRWGWGSGCRGADLIGVGIKVEGAGPSGGLPLIAVMPASRVRIEDNWDVIGMQGTGSHDMVVDKVVVPEEWTFVRGGPSSLETPLYRYPSMPLAAQVLSVVGLGIARAALDCLIELAGGRTSITGAPTLALREYVQADVAKAEAGLRSARAFFYEATDQAFDTLMRGDELDVAARSLLRLASTNAAHVAADVCRTVYRLSGTTGISAEHPISRYVHNSMIVPQHAFLADGTWQNAGKILLGLDATPAFLDKQRSKTDDRYPCKTLRVLFCAAVLQNFFDLPAAEIGKVWAATGAMLKGIRDLPGVTVLGTMDDDETMVGTSPNGWPWTFYILADVPDRATVVAGCNLFRTIEVGEHRLWKYMRVEARIGRELVIPA